MVVVLYIFISDGSFSPFWLSQVEDVSESPRPRLHVMSGVVVEYSPASSPCLGCGCGQVGRLRLSCCNWQGFVRRVAHISQTEQRRVRRPSPSPPLQVENAIVCLTVHSCLSARRTASSLSCWMNCFRSVSRSDDSVSTSLFSCVASWPSRSVSSVSC